jgi:hypothetical protein
LPTVKLAEIDIALEAKEAAERAATRRIICQGSDAWDTIHKSESFEGWAALARP